MLNLSGYPLGEKLYESDRTLVYRARRPADDCPVVLKVLKSAYPSPERIAWFKREYELTCRLNLAGLVRAYSLELDQPHWVMVLEDFGAQSLHQLQLAGRLGSADFLRLAIKLADGLGQLHGERIIHKDINPTNIVLNSETGQVKLIDLGISSALPRENPIFSNGSVLAGTLPYLSPEQTGRMNRAVDYRTDFYSLGVTFYELLTGQLPFKSANALELMHAHIAKQPCPPTELNPNVPRSVSQVILKLMAKNVEDRYQSAYGLKMDLEIALQQLQVEGESELFSLGQRDVSDRFQIPQKLYGREAEIAVLLAACERVGAGASEMMLVSGHPGIGKSALIQEIYKPVTRQNGYFIAGKFDQVQRSIPYAALLQAFRSLMRQLLTEGETQVRVWREKLLAACAPNLQVIQAVIPEVERIVGPQPEAPTLLPTEAQNRFQWVFQNFIQVFAQMDHPLVIFLDDLQWADGASLKLIEVLMTAAPSHHLCLIAAYRGNETGADHPWLLTLQGLEKVGVVMNRIGLGALSSAHVSEWVADTLNCSLEQAQPLGELVWSKTGGNPFFVGEFLKFLHAHQWIAFDHAQGRWRWALSQIRAQKSTDNVVELLITRVQQLGPATQLVLELAACIGNQFDLDMLAVVGGKTRSETATDLRAALAEGLILPLEETYPLMELDIQGLADQLTAEYKFAHDRIQQAAYSLIPEALRPAMHLRIGRRLLEKIRLEERDLRVFEIVNQLNHGRALIQLPAERRHLAELNLRAGRKAKTSAAYEPALHYLQIGLELLTRESWQLNYDQALALHVEAAEAAYLNADFNLMDQLIERVRQQAQTPLDQGKVYEILIQSHFVRNNLSEAVPVALRVLELLGVEFPAKPTQLHILLGLARTFLRLWRKNPEDLASLPTMVDPRKQAAMRVILSVIPTAYVTAPNLVPLFVFQMIHLSLGYGNTPASAFGYAAYGLILCGVVGQIEAGYRFGRLALQLLERFNAQEFKALTYVYANGFVFHWKDHFRETLAPLLEAYRSGLDHGDLNGAMLGALFYDYHAYLSGRELEVLAAEMGAYSQIMRRFKQVTNFNYNELYRQAVLNFLGRSPDPRRLVGESYDADKMLPQHLAANERSIIFNIYFNQLILCYFFGDFRGALENANQTRHYLDGAVAALASGVFYFYDSLACLAGCAEASRAEQKQLLKRVAANQTKLKAWSQHAPMNYQHKLRLVEAELARVLGKEKDAREGYRQAITLARQNEFVNEEALACELAARFYLAQEEPTLAQTRLREAHDAYWRWGAHGKLRELEAQYSALLAQAEPDTLNGSLITATINVLGKPISFDLMSAVKASYSLSSEIALEELLTKLMKIVIENAGAQAGYLLLPKDGAWVVETEATADEAGVSVLRPRLPSEARLPLSIIHYVARTQESLVLDDALHEGLFAHDPEVLARRSCSVLCSPLILKNKVTGILYLENNLAARAFTPDRLALLKLIAGQAAISLENARLYAEVTQEITERRRAEETAQASQQRFQNLFENAPLYICEVDIAQTPAVVLQANSRLRQIYGWPEEAFIKLPPFEQLMPPESVPGASRLMQRVRAGQTVTIESVMRARDGSLFPVRLTVAPEPDPVGVNRIIAVMEDITAEKQRRSEVEAINEDRRRIAHEIHDGLTQNLIGLRIRTGLWHKLVDTDPAQLHGALDEMRAILSASIDEVRRSIFALRPIELAEAGFFLSLRQFITAAREQYRLEIVLEIYGPEDRLPTSLEHTLFRVIQEALNNVIKHAQANHVWIRLDLEKSERLTLTLQDDGVGFDPTQLAWAVRDGHLGLKQMQERVEHAHGILSIASRPGEGTMLQLTLPLT